MAKDDTILNIFTILFSVYVNLLTIYGANGIVHYKITSHHTCLSSNTILYNVNGISVQQCVEECAILPNCSAVSYKRLYKLCELHSVLFKDRVARSGESCLYVKRSDIHSEEQSTNVCQICGDGNCGTNQCDSKFCDAFEVKDGAFLGNMKAVGSRVEITCHKYFKEVSGKTHSVCQRNGTWSHYPSCIPNFTYIGCFEDRPDRILYDRDIRPPLLTTDMCIRICIEYDHEYSLTEAGYACFCGDTLKKYPRQPENECNKPCQGNQSEMCGGSWRGSLYRHG